MGRVQFCHSLEQRLQMQRVAGGVTTGKTSLTLHQWQEVSTRISKGRQCLSPLELVLSALAWSDLGQLRLSPAGG